MILADTSVWVGHFRSADRALQDLLAGQALLGHAFVTGELALGNLPDRSRTLFLLAHLPQAAVARDHEVLRMVESRPLHGRGIGYVDAHLIASVLLTPGARLWTRDRRLAALAAEMGIAAPEA